MHAVGLPLILPLRGHHACARRIRIRRRTQNLTQTPVRLLTSYYLLELTNPLWVMYQWAAQLTQQLCSHRLPHHFICELLHFVIFSNLYLVNEKILGLHQATNNKQTRVLCVNINGGRPRTHERSGAPMSLFDYVCTVANALRLQFTIYSCTYLT